MAVDWLQTYRASLYALPARSGGGETCFALDGPDAEAGEGARRLGLATSATFITGWNPESEEMPRDWNERANRGLAAALQEAGVEFLPSYGASLPDTEPAWREEGFVLFGLGRDDAAEWGRAWRQRALVFVDPDGAGLLFCADGAFHPCGVRLLRCPGIGRGPDGSRQDG